MGRNLEKVTVFISFHTNGKIKTTQKMFNQQQICASLKTDSSYFDTYIDVALADRELLACSLSKAAVIM